MTAPAIHRQPVPISDGDVFPSWCSKCHDRTDHQYRPEALRKLACLRCEQNNEKKGEQK